MATRAGVVEKRQRDRVTPFFPHFAMQRPTRSCRTRGPTITIARSSCDDDSDECLPDPPEKEYKPGGKRARCATSDGRDEDADERPAALSRKRAKRAGKLARLQQMPLDVLFEVRRCVLQALDGALTGRPRSSLLFIPTTCSGSPERRRPCGGFLWPAPRALSGCRRSPLSPISLLVRTTSPSPLGRAYSSTPHAT
jgi:hypothetical protein